MQMTAGRWMSLAGICLFAALAAGCLRPRSPAPVHTYLLGTQPEMWESQPAEASQPTHGVLLLSPPQAEPGFETPRMVYVTRAHEVSYYATNQWVDVPARMIMPLLIQGLERSGVWQAVAPLPSAIRGDYRLDADGLVLQQEFLQQPSQVRLALRLQLIALQAGHVIGTRRFEVVEPAPSDDPYGGVVAAGRAVSKLLDHAAVWARSCVSKNEGCR
jgi:cholesterol transport system auxiliary component